MDIIICGWTAFQYMRKPPVVRMLEAWLSSHPEVVLPGNKDWCTTGAHESLRPAPECPIDVLACSEKERLRGKGFRSHRLTGADASLLTRSVHPAPLAQDRHKRRIDRITTPAATLLTMAMDIGHEKLALAASELLGSFSVFTPNPFCQAILDGLVREGPVSRELAEVIRLVPRDIRSLARYGGGDRHINEMAARPPCGEGLPSLRPKSLIASRNKPITCVEAQRCHERHISRSPEPPRRSKPRPGYF